MSVGKKACIEHRGVQPGSRVIAAIPCYNEERYIGSVVLKARRYVDQVLVIDDGSSDASAEVALAAGAVVHRHPCNQGYGSAIRTAIEKARELDPDVLVMIDGDGQHDPREIPLLVGPVLSGDADVVIGSRFLNSQNRPPLYRQFGQRFLTAATNIGSGRRVTDSQSGFRAYSNKALKVLNLSEDGMSISSEIQFALSQSGLRVAEVPISVSYFDKSKRNPVGHGASVFAKILVLISLRQPMVLFGIPGLALLAGGIALGIRVWSIYNEIQTLAMGNALASILLTLSGLLALFAAVILQSMKELLRREWEQFKSRQAFRMEEVDDGLEVSESDAQEPVAAAEAGRPWVH